MDERFFFVFADFEIDDGPFQIVSTRQTLLKNHENRCTLILMNIHQFSSTSCVTKHMFSTVQTQKKISSNSYSF